MIDEGKSNIEWERKVPAEKIQDLKDLLSADDFDANLPTVTRGESLKKREIG